MSRRSELDWTSALDFQAAFNNVGTDLKGDWYRDPWGWPELEWMVKESNLQTAVERIEQKRFAPLEPIDIPKEGFSTRPAVVLDIVDRLIYQAVVDRMSPKLIGGLPPWVYGWRQPPDEKSPGKYARGDYQWENYRKRLRGLARVHRHQLKTDVTSCFASISVPRIMEVVRHRYGGNQLSDLLEVLVKNCGLAKSRRGLPQRCMASSVLANAYLQPLDEMLAAEMTRGPSEESTPAVVRWMDDIAIFADDPAELRRLQIALSAQMREIGMEMNSAKTMIVEGGPMRQAIADMELAAVDYGLGKPGGLDRKPLDALLKSTLEHGEKVGRTEVRFLTTRIRKAKLFDTVQKFVDMLPQTPHVADHVGRLLASSGSWRQLEDWFTNYAGSRWALFDWSTASLGTMFPAKEAPGPKVIDIFFGMLKEPRSLVKTAIAAQRLAAWVPADAQHALRKAAENEHHHLRRRVLGLGLCATGEQPGRTRRLLSELRENRPTLQMLEGRNFKAPKISPDFAGR